MNNIVKVDKNFAVSTKIEKDDIKFYDVLSEPFKIYGVFREGGKWRRMPEAVAKTVSEGVYSLHANTAGGRVRFKTDSPYIAINTKLSGLGRMSHFTLCGAAGFDLYLNGAHQGSFRPPFDMVDGYEALRDGYSSIDGYGTSEMRDVEINFPLYTDVLELYIGVSENSKILPPDPYKIERPVVYYGSSITQGGCASRPGACYQAILSRELSVDHINLGFSGNAKGEPEIANYIKSLDMSVFVYDYDFNAPDLAHLEATHEKMFRVIREANPTLPILIMSKPKPVLDATNIKRFECIKRTYENAKASGDENVYFIDGRELMAFAGKEGTVDTTHPTDFGFFSMATRISPVLKEILYK